MSKKTLLFGAIASILTINSVIANTVVTSQTYVDNADALKQDKITAGTTGNVVLYNGTQNGQTQFSERAIYDGTNEYDSSTDANKLITAGAVDGMVGDVYDYVDDEISNIPAPELPTGNPGYAVLYDENGDIGDEMIILDENFYLLSGESSYDLDGDGYGLLTQRVLGSNTDLTSDLTGSGKIYPTVSGVRGYAQPSIPAGTQGSVVIYNGTVDSGLLQGKTKFTEKAIANAPIITNGTLTNGNDIASINAVQTKQNKMTCTRWIDNAAHTDANCLLWNMAN